MLTPEQYGIALGIGLILTVILTLIILHKWSE